MLTLDNTHNEIATASGSRYLVSFNADGTGFATVDSDDIHGAQVIEHFASLDSRSTSWAASFVPGSTASALWIVTRSSSTASAGGSA